MPKIVFETDRAAIAAANKRKDSTQDDFYSETNAYILATMSKATYQTEINIKSLSKEWGFNEPIIITRDKLRAVIFYNQDDIVIAFRGSDNLSNWIVDMELAGQNGDHASEGYETVHNPTGASKFDKKMSKLQVMLGRGFLLHKGFDRSLQQLWHDSGHEQGIRTHLRDIIAANVFSQKVHNIWLTGHSLGGAMAILARYILARSMLPTHSLHEVITNDHPIAVYTIGSPRCGNKEFARQYNKHCPEDTFRVVNHNDPIPQLPSSYFLMVYKHVGESRTYFSDIMYPNMTRNERIKHSLKNAIFNILSYGPNLIFKPIAAAFGIDDHRSGEYMDTLSRALKEDGCDPNLLILTDIEKIVERLDLTANETQIDIKDLKSHNIHTTNAVVQLTQKYRQQNQALFRLYTLMKLQHPDYKDSFIENEAATKIQSISRGHVARKYTDFERLGLLLHSPQYTAAVGRPVASVKQIRWTELSADKKNRLRDFTRAQMRACLHEETNKVSSQLKSR